MEVRAIIMIVKAFSTGISSASGPIDYLFGKKDAKGIKRSYDPVLMRGDPELTALLIDSSTRKWKYTSGVLSFDDRDQVAENVQIDIMNRFEEFAFAGKPEDNWNCLWVKHEDKGRVELHFLIPRMDLETGQDLNAFARGWDRDWRPWQRDMCSRLNLTDPHNLRKLTKQPQFEGGNNGEKRFDDKASLLAFFEAAALEGKIQTREQLLEAASEIGELNRVGKDYISIKIDEHPKPMRLKGDLFNERFNFKTKQVELEAEPSADQGLRDGTSRNGEISEDPSPFRVGDSDTEFSNAVREAFRRRQKRFNDLRRKSKTLHRDRGTEQRDDLGRNDGANGGSSEKNRNFEQDILELENQRREFGYENAMADFDGERMGEQENDHLDSDRSNDTSRGIHDLWDEHGRQTNDYERTGRIIDIEHADQREAAVGGTISGGVSNFNHLEIWDTETNSDRVAKRHEVSKSSKPQRAGSGVEQTQFLGDKLSDRSRKIFNGIARRNRQNFTNASASHHSAHQITRDSEQRTRNGQSAIERIRNLASIIQRRIAEWAEKARQLINEKLVKPLQNYSSGPGF